MVISFYDQSLLTHKIIYLNGFGVVYSALRNGKNWLYLFNENYAPLAASGEIQNLLQSLANFTALDETTVILLLAVSLLAGLVRGFSGFALSAVVMASLSTIVPPVELLPMSTLLEAFAGLFMARGGIRNAEMKIVWGLVIGNVIGVPLGLLIITQVDVEFSKILALLIILTLAILVFVKLKAQFLATKSGLYISGIIAGVATGIASVGGMVVALYVLARNRPAAQMRGTLVMFLIFSLIGTGSFQFLYGVFTLESFKRAIIMMPLLTIGILIGTTFFNPSLQRFYKPVCLVILMSICAINLAKQLF